jgi:K+-transporting ATPase ATPase C chain
MRAPLAVFLSLTLLCGVVYPVVVTFVAAVLFASAAHGSVITVDGKARGSELIGQPFDRPDLFWGRLSATAPVPYSPFDGASGNGSTGTNFGPLNPDLVKAAQARIDALRQAERALGVAERPVPIDLVTSSGSGLDPHISPAAAEYQVERVAAARGVPPERVRALVRACTEGRALGLLGEPVVNVLRLDLLLERQLGRAPAGR